MLTLNTNTDTALRERKRSLSLLFPVILAIACCITVLSVLMAIGLGVGLFFGLLVVLVVLALIVLQPVIGCYLVLLTAVVIEAEPLTNAILTDRIIERPIGFLLLFILAVFICRRLIHREPIVIRSGQLILPFVLFLLCIAQGAIHGLTSGGNLQEIIGEIRPFWYLFLSYLLAINLVTSKTHVRVIMWIVILGAFVKGLQGVYVVLIVFHANLTGHFTILAHEESFFFVGLLVLLLLFCLHYRYRPQFYAALCVSPFVLFSLVANQRRTDYVALVVAIGVIWALIYKIKVKARRALLTLAIVCVVLGGGYMPAFAQGTGVIAAPAHAVISVFAPSASDTKTLDSNIYRTIENHDLIYTLKQSPWIGYGFGKPFLEPIPLTSIYPQVLHDDPIYNYVPHNNVFWVLMRLGVIGFLAFWFLVGSAIVRGCFIARELKDKYLQLVAIFVVAMVVVEILAAYADYQLYFFRNIIYIGILLGVLMRLPALDAERN